MTERTAERAGALSTPARTPAMTHVPDAPAPLSPEPAPRGGGWLSSLFSWAVIAAAVGGVLALRALDAAPSGTDERAGPGERPLQLIVQELQMRLLVGAKALKTAADPQQPAPDLYEAAQPYGRGTVAQRLRFVVVAGELIDPAEALRQLDEFDAAVRQANRALTPEEAETRDHLRRLYREYARGAWAAPSFLAADRAALVDRLGWFGTLAQYPPGSLGVDPDGRELALEPAWRTLLAFLGAAAVAGVLLVAGFAGLALLGWLRQSGRLALGLDCGHTAAGVYAETFALWLPAFYGLSLAAAWLMSDGRPLAGWPRLPVTSAVMGLSLGVLAWPVLRGVPWRRLRAEIGWHAGRGFLFTELGAGVFCYVANLPLVLLGLTVTARLITAQNLLPAADGGGDAFAGTHMPAHPIIQSLASGDAAQLWPVFLLASVVAPVVEETMFRGVLYRHLRELSCGWRFTASFVFSTLVSSFVFAVIHPQGLAAVPVLMSLAFGFCLYREWRGTLLGGMFAHGLNNALVMTFATIALSR